MYLCPFPLFRKKEMKRRRPWWGVKFVPTFLHRLDQFDSFIVDSLDYRRWNPSSYCMLACESAIYLVMHIVYIRSIGAHDPRNKASLLLRRSERQRTISSKIYIHIYSKSGQDHTPLYVYKYIGKSMDSVTPINNNFNIRSNSDWLASQAESPHFCSREDKTREVDNKRSHYTLRVKYFLHYSSPSYLRT